MEVESPEIERCLRKVVNTCLAMTVLHSRRDCDGSVEKVRRDKEELEMESGTS